MDNALPLIQSVLTTTPLRWQNMTTTLPKELLLRPPAPKEWSAVECLLHLLDAERYVFPTRIEAFLAGRDFAGFNPDTQGSKLNAERTPADVAAEFAQHRAASLKTLARLTAADFPRTARHGELGIVSLGEMLHEWAAHDLMHTVQAERAVMQPFIAASGPWRMYFKDHDVEALI